MNDRGAGALPSTFASGRRPTGRTVRTLALLLPVIVSAVAFLAWSQSWVTVTLVDGATVVAAGDASAPAVPPFALAAVALVGALALAGPVFRVVLGVLQALLGSGIAASGLLVIADPVQAAGIRITEATGIAGIDAVRGLVEQTQLSVWPAVATAAGVAGVVIGIAIAATATRWPPRTRRFEPVRFAAPDDAADDTPIADRLDAWDALSDGDDPTAR